MKMKMKMKKKSNKAKNKNRPAPKLHTDFNELTSRDADDDESSLNNTKNNELETDNNHIAVTSSEISQNKEQVQESKIDASNHSVKDVVIQIHVNQLTSHDEITAQELINTENVELQRFAEEVFKYLQKSEEVQSPNKYLTHNVPSPEPSIVISPKKGETEREKMERHMREALGVPQSISLTTEDFVPSPGTVHQPAGTPIRAPSDNSASTIENHITPLQFESLHEKERREIEQKLIMKTPQSKEKVEFQEYNPNDISGIVLPFDFAMQQKSEEKRRRIYEREIREGLKSPQPTPSQDYNDADNDDVVTSFDFAMQQNALKKKRREKERLTKEALSKPLNEFNNSYTPPSSNGFVSHEDFIKQQRTVEKQRREKERQTKVSLSNPEKPVSVLKSAAENQALEMKVLVEEQRRKKKEAQALVSCHRTYSLNEGNAQARMAAKIKAREKEERQKKREALELVSSHQNHSASEGSAQCRMAAELKALEKERRRKKKEAQDMVVGYRNYNVNEGNAQSRMAAELKTLKEEQGRKKREAQAYVSSYSPKDEGDAQTRMAAEIKAREAEERRKKKEAQVFASEHHTNSLCEGDALSRMAVEIKAREKEQKRKKNEADYLNRSFRYKKPLDEEKMIVLTESDRKAAELKELEEIDHIVLLISAEQMNDNLNDIQTTKSADLNALEERQICMNKETQEKVENGDTTQNLEAIQSRTNAELKTLEEEIAKARLHQSLEEAPPSNNIYLEEIQSRIASELEALKESRSKEINDSSQCQNQSLEEFKLRTTELAAFQKKSVRSKIIPAEAWSKEVSSSSRLDNAKSRTAAELAALKKNSVSMKYNAEVFDCGDEQAKESRGSLDVKSRTAAELAALKGSQRQAKETKSARRCGNVEDIKSKTSAELQALQSGNSNNLKKTAEALNHKKTSDGLDVLRSRAAAELAGLNKNSFMKQKVFSPENKKSFKSREKSELMALKANSKSMKMLTEEFSRGVKGSGVDEIKSRTAAELHQLAGGSKHVMEEFNNAGRRTQGVDEIKSRTAAELNELQGGYKNAMQEFNQSRKNFARNFGNGTSMEITERESFKCRTDSELKALQLQPQSKSMKQMTKIFNLGLKTDKALMEQRVKRETENEVVMQGTEVNQPPDSPPKLTHDSLQVIKNEREALPKESEG